MAQGEHSALEESSAIEMEVTSSPGRRIKITTRTTKTTKHKETMVPASPSAAHQSIETVQTETKEVTTTTYTDSPSKVISRDVKGEHGREPSGIKFAGLSIHANEDVLPRIVSIPSEEDIEQVWDKKRIEFARKCTLQRYDNEECSGNNDGVAVASNNDATPPRAKSKASAMSPSSSGRKMGLGSMRKSPSSSAKSPTSTKKELPDQLIPTNSWTVVEASKFKLRVGPNYAKYGQKEPSEEALYETVCVRLFQSNQKTEGVVDVLPLPILEAFGSEGDHHNPWEDHGDLAIDPSIPDLFVLHVQMPFNSPSMFNPTDDGPGPEAIVYLRPAPRFVAEITGKKAMTPATRLFVKWCQSCETNTAMKSRFKCMALVHQLEAHNLGWVSPYNGKPVLITESGSARRGIKDGIRYLEMTASVHKWGYLAKKGFVTILPRFKELRLDIGFTIEGKADEELPECLLGCFTANFCDPDLFESISKEMQQKPN